MVEGMGIDRRAEACCLLGASPLGAGVHWVNLGRGVVVVQRVP